ncbi:hypothetical protein M8818_002158 [Zalaria obscura]|uniref:Uncharacterized protein n=1 Tax=Zalaria obscura TaxID=2024903 RepID=A0ACC3SIM2_9PEZI
MQESREAGPGCNIATLHACLAGSSPILSPRVSGYQIASVSIPVPVRYILIGFVFLWCLTLVLKRQNGDHKQQTLIGTVGKSPTAARILHDPKPKPYLRTLLRTQHRCTRFDFAAHFPNNRVSNLYDVRGNYSKHLPNLQRSASGSRAYSGSLSQNPIPGCVTLSKRDPFDLQQQFTKLCEGSS